MSDKENQAVTEEFLDTYEGEILFLSQDLEEIIEAIGTQSADKETFILLSEKLLEVGDVFLSSTYTQHVAPIFKLFSEYIEQLDVDDFMQYSDAREYLKEIISDINNYINFYFVQRIFSDVYLFQDSLKNSIEFLQRAYSCDIGECDSDDDGSELDFF